MEFAIAQQFPQHYLQWFVSICLELGDAFLESNLGSTERQRRVGERTSSYQLAFVGRLEWRWRLSVKRRRGQEQQRINVILDITVREVETDSANSQCPQPGVPH